MEVSDGADDRMAFRPSPTNSLLTYGVVAAVVAALPTIVQSRNWMLDNLTSFTLQVLGVLLVLTLTAWIRRLTAIALFGSLTAAALMLRTWPHIAVAEGRAAPASLTWLVANVHTANRHHAALVKLIRESNPTLIGLVETNSRWLQALEGPLADYPYRVLLPREDNFGMALFSRVKLVDPVVAAFGVTPTITTTVALEEHELDLVLVHVLPPINDDYASDRDRQLTHIGKLRPRKGHGLVIAGDFNATPYSPTFGAAFEQPTFRRAAGLSGTFPAAFPAPLRIPIDHALSAGAVNIRQRIERDIHSDHLPFTVAITIPAPP